MRAVYFIAAMFFMSGCARVHHRSLETIKFKDASLKNASFSGVVFCLANAKRLVCSQTSIAQIVGAILVCNGRVFV